jgi:hypothetical protein
MGPDSGKSGPQEPGQKGGKWPGSLFTLLILAARVHGVNAFLLRQIEIFTSFIGTEPLMTLPSGMVTSIVSSSTVSNSSNQV